MKLPRSTRLALSLLLVGGCSAVGADCALRGGPPNAVLPTLGGTQFWADVAWADGWRVQRHVWSRHCRLLDADDVRRAWGTEAHCRAGLPAGEGAGHLVVLLHGLGRTRGSLEPLRDELEGAGFRVASLGYPSTRASIEEHARCVEQVLDSVDGVERVSFVTHSLGGRVVLRLLERDGAWRERIEVGGVVQLAPPNRGSLLAAELRDVPFVGLVLGPSFVELAERESEAAPHGCALGVVAARSDRGGNPWIPGADDLVVGVGETRPAFAHEFLAVRGVHTFVMRDPEVARRVACFLRSGSFGA